MQKLLRYLAVLWIPLLGILLSSGSNTLQATPTAFGDLILVGIGDGPLTGGNPKFLEFYAVNNIPDLSVYGIGTANNGGGSDGIEWNFPTASIPAGTNFFLARDSALFNDFFGFNADFIDAGIVTNFNGDDAVELFENSTRVDVFGDTLLDGTGEPWEYTDGWAKRKDSTGPDGTTFMLNSWTYSGINVFDGQSTNATSPTPYPLTPYMPGNGGTGGTGGGSVEMVLKGVIDGPVTAIRAVEFEVMADISDLSIYGIGVTNNGGGSDGEEFSFPAGSALKGDRIYVARDSAAFRDFFGFDADYIDVGPAALNFNGDDGIEIFRDGQVVETFGDIQLDGTGEPWEYTDGWAHRKDGTGPDTMGFVLANWDFSPLDNFDGTTTNVGSPLPYPVFSVTSTSTDLVLVGLIHANADAKATEYYVLNDIPDLSIYGVGCANNGGGTDSVEFSFPAVSASKGDRLYISRDSAAFRDFFGFDATFIDSSSSTAHNFNGDDAFELFENGVVIDVYGDINVDGTGEPWEYNDTWAQRNCATGPDSSTFVLSSWTVAAIDNFVGIATNDLAAEPYPVDVYQPIPCGPLGGGTDLVITEIMYNSPGTDLEYLEFYNNTAAPIDLSGYSIANAVNFSFPAVTLQPGEYFLITDDSVGMANFWGVTAYRWESGSLNNGGEAITLKDSTGEVIDSVFFDDAAPWPTTPDGRGPSLVLCDPNSDNNVGSNWQRAITSSGNIFDGREVFGNPADTAVCVDNPIIALQAAEVITGEADGDLTVLFYIDNPDSANATSVDLAILPGGTADASDYTFTATTITFPAGTDTAQFVVVGIVDDGDQEAEESFTLAISNPSNGAQITNDTLQIRIIDNDAPITSSLKLIGLVHGPNSGVPKAVEILAEQDIPNLSLYGLGCANNGGGTDGQEYTFPAVSIDAGTCFWVANDTAGFRQFFGFSADFEDQGAANNFNGDDAFEIFESGTVIDVFGEIDADGTGTAWEYTLGWAHRVAGTGPDDSTFVLGNWEISDLNEFSTVTINADAANPYPVNQCDVTSIEDHLGSSPRIRLYPNPTAGSFSFESPERVEKVRILNLVGQVLIEENFQTKEGRLDLSRLRPNLYLVQFMTETETWSEKLTLSY